TPAGGEALEVDHWYYGPRWLFVDTLGERLFTNNDSNWHRLFGGENATPYVKDAIHEYVVHGVRDAVSPFERGTKAASHHVLRLESGATHSIRLRLCDDPALIDDPAALRSVFDAVFAQRRAEADEFYSVLAPPGLSSDGHAVMRQAFAGLLWSKQYYAY